MNRKIEEQAIARDLELCDIIAALGSRSAKAKARKHRKACMAQIKAWNKADGLDQISTEELMAELAGLA